MESTSSGLFSYDGKHSRRCQLRRCSDFAGRVGVRLQSYVAYLSGTPESYGEELALLVSLIAGGKLHPQIGSDKGWRELLQVMTDLRERHIPGKAVFHVD